MKKVLIGLGAVAVIVASVPMFAAYEAHVINVTAHIENALKVDTKAIEFGTVFPEEKLESQFTVLLSDSFVSSQGCGNLISNGSFENPEVTDPAMWQIFPDGTAGLGWNVEWETGVNTYNSATRPNPALQELHEGVLGPAAQGDQYAELDTDWDGPSGALNGEPALVKIHQNISTVPGGKYELRYAYSPRPSTPIGDNLLLVRIDNAQVQSQQLAGGGSIVWNYYTYQFIATSATTKIEFAGGGANNSLGVFLDDVSVTCIGKEVTYVLRQKPKCVDNQDATKHPLVTEDANGNFICPEGSTMMPFLCPYLSKHEITTDGALNENDGPGITAFHGLPLPWTMQTTLDTQREGRLSITNQDSLDTWVIDLKVPCFKGSCAQDWPEFVRTESGDPSIDPLLYEANPLDESKTWGCDLWVEVTGISVLTQ